MKRIQMFKTDDGRVLESQQEAENYESLIDKVNAVSKLLGGTKTDPEGDFSNGGGYYQIEAEDIRRFDTQFLGLLKEHFPTTVSDILKVNQFGSEEQLVTTGYVGRFLCDSDSLLYNLYCMRLCIDSKGRRWGQPYFANNPSKGKSINLGK